MIYGKTEYWRSWDASTLRADRIQPHYFRANRLLRPPDLLVRHLSLRAAYPCMGSLLVRRRAFLAVGGFEESFRGFGEDLVFFAKFCLRHPVYVSDECWDRYRQHSDSVTALAEAQGGIRRGASGRIYPGWPGTLSSKASEMRVCTRRCVLRCGAVIEHLITGGRDSSGCSGARRFWRFEF